MSNTPRFSFVLEYVPDVAAAKAFYTEILGLKVTRESPEFVQFADANGVGWAIASDVSLSGDNRPETYWEVEDAATLANTLRATATIRHPLEQRPYGRVFGVADPAGETQYFVQFAQRRPSTAVE